jgi:CRP-like cAMP-binding protein
MKTNYNQHSMELEGFGIDSQFGNHKYDAKKVSHLFSTAKQIQYEPQQSIFQEGQSADTIFFIRKGMVKLISYLPNGNARIVRLLGPGKILGLEGMVGNTYEHSAVAIHSLELLKIPAKTVQRMKIQEPEKFFLLGEQWYDDVRSADTWITQFSTGSITARVARLVTFLSYIETETAPDQVELLKVEEMAAVLGVTPESVSRVLARFKRQQALQRTNAHDDYHYTRNSGMLEELALDQ